MARDSGVRVHRAAVAPGSWCSVARAGERVWLIAFRPTWVDRAGVVSFSHGEGTPVTGWEQEEAQRRLTTVGTFADLAQEPLAEGLLLHNAGEALAFCYVVTLPASADTPEARERLRPEVQRLMDESAEQATRERRDATRAMLFDRGMFGGLSTKEQERLVDIRAGLAGV